MADYIDKNELYKKGESLLNSFINGKKNGEQAFRDLFNAIADMPTVKQKHGHWIEDEFKTLDNMNVVTVYRCSECGESTDAEDLPYCYRCGAKMDEVTE